MPKFWLQKKKNNFLKFSLRIHTRMSDKLFRILVFYLMHAIFLGKIAERTWQSKIGNNLMLSILQYFVKQSSVRFGITLYSVLSFY